MLYEMSTIEMIENLKIEDKKRDRTLKHKGEILHPKMSQYQHTLGHNLAPQKQSA